MDHAEKLSITLPANLARLVRDKVKTGAYASNSEVIRDALRVWHERETRVLDPIRELIDEAMSDPRPLIPAKQVFDGLRKLHEKAAKGRHRAK